jgi:hypothetical protein
MPESQSTIARHTTASNPAGELSFSVAVTSEGLIIGGEGSQQAPPLPAIPFPPNTDWNTQFAAWASTKIVSPRVVSLRALTPNVVEVWIKAFIVATEVEAQETIATSVPPEVALPNTDTE